MIPDNLIEENMLTIQFLENKIISGIFKKNPLNRSLTSVHRVCFLFFFSKRSKKNERIILFYLKQIISIFNTT